MIKGQLDINLKEKDIFSSLPLNQIVALYEKMEILLFPYLNDHLRPEFKAMDNENYIRGQITKMLTACDD